MSSYVKALEGVMRLFPKKINVTFRHVAGELIGQCKIYEEQLPEIFKRPMIMEAMGRSWRVLEAHPRLNKDFVFTRKLELEVVEPELAEKYVSEYFTATIAGRMPDVAVEGINTDFGIDLSENDWRQVELLPASYLSMATEEIAVIEGVLRPGKEVNVLRGYGRRHVRKRVGAGSLDISIDEFCKVVDASELDSLRFNNSYVKNGFVLRSAGFIYYGTTKENVIKNLCIYKFDCPDYELFTVLTSFDLFMVHWCKAKIFTSEVSDKNEISDVPAANDATNFM